MADYTISAKITGDASGYESAVNKANKASSKLSKTVSDVLKGFGKGGLGSSLGQIALGFGSVTTAVSVCTKTLKGCVKAINETSEAYKVQMKVEKQLEQASKNNPYISDDSIKRLKAYASEIQNISNYGDEELIGKMSQLVALGRNEAEVMKIIKVATDMSADGSMTLDTAITQLNATLNGNIGRLGQQNKELKTLTQEELESGKAIDILGEKFKGMAEATADTSTQMKNLKGDFKEAIGRFTLPTSDLWNKFWSGFYKQGASVINKLSDDIEKRAVNKALAQYGEQNYQTILKGIDRKQSTQKSALGIKSYARSMTSSMLDVTVSYLENEYPQLIQDSQTEEGIIYNILKAEQSRKQEIKKEREEEEARLQKLAEEQAERQRLNEEQTKFVTDLKQKHLDAIKQKEEEWKYTEEITEQEIDLNDKLSFYQKDLIDIMTEGAGLITKDNEYYKQQIALINKIKKELKEKNKTQEESTETETEVIGFWDRILEKIKEVIKYLKENWKSVIKTMISATLQFGVVVASKMKEVISKVFSTIKGIFKSGVSLFSSLFNFNPDDALDMILKAEDNILTFFVETLPKMKGFFSSVIQSIVVLINNLVATIDWDFITEMVLDIIQNIRQNVPQVLTGLITIFKELVKTFVSIVTQFISSGGWRDLLNLVLTIQKELEKAVTDNIDEIAEAITSMLPDLVETLVQSIVSASQTLGKLAKTLLPLIAKIIVAIIDVITDNRVIESSTEAIEEIVEALVPAIVELAVRAIPKIITMILVKLPSYTPNLIMGIVQGLADGFAKVNWGEALKGLWNGLVDFFSGIWDAIVNLFVDKIGGGFKKAFEQNDSTQTGTVAGDVGLGILTGGVSTIGHLFHWWADGTQNAPSGLSVVGEAGPELVRFRGGEQVINARNTQKLLADTNGNTNNFNVTFNNLNDTSAYAMMNELKQYNRAMAINGIL